MVILEIKDDINYEYVKIIHVNMHDCSIKCQQNIRLHAKFFYTISAETYVSQCWNKIHLNTSKSNSISGKE